MQNEREKGKGRDIEWDSKSIGPYGFILVVDYFGDVIAGLLHQKRRVDVDHDHGRRRPQRRCRCRRGW